MWSSERNTKLANVRFPYQTDGTISAFISTEKVLTGVSDARSVMSTVHLTMSCSQLIHLTGHRFDCASQSDNIHKWSVQTGYFYIGRGS